jgi:L-lactate dehydrogenase complex protein LldG
VADSKSREAILETVRSALRCKPSATGSHRAPVSNQATSKLTQTKSNGDPAPDETIQRFASELMRIGGRFQRCASDKGAFEYIEQLALDRRAKVVVSWDVPLLPAVDLRARFEEKGIIFEKGITGRELISKAAEADIGISGVDYALADTGTLVLFAGELQPRSVSLLPPVHVAIVRPQQILPELSDLFPLLQGESNGLRNLSSAITFITGPSRTADIELKLVVGVHGPQELHVLMLD